MTTLNFIDLQTGLPHPHASVTAHEHVGFELGWDYAHHRVTPPAPYAQEPSPLRNGLLAGQAARGLVRRKGRAGEAALSQAAESTTEWRGAAGPRT